MTPETLARVWPLLLAKGVRWQPGMLLHTTGAGGLPRSEAGTPVRLEHDNIDDMISENMVGCGCDVLCDEQECHLDDGKFSYGPCRAFSLPQPVPDLDDPATIGCLTRAARKVWGPEFNICPVVRLGVTIFDAWVDHDGLIAKTTSEGETLIRALCMKLEIPCEP